MPGFKRGKRSKSKKTSRKTVAKKHSPSKSLSYKQNFATSVETFDATDLLSNTVYGLNFDLSLFDRSREIAVNYQWYRAAEVEWSIEPFYNVFQDASTGNPTVPQALIQMNRTGQNNIGSRAQMEAMGSIPKRFTSNIIVKYKPNTVSYQYNTQSTNAQVGMAEAIGKWLAIQGTAAGSPVDLNLTPYYGALVFLDQAASIGGSQTLARITCTVKWEFKEPYVNVAAIGSTVPITVRSV